MQYNSSTLEQFKATIKTFIPVVSVWKPLTKTAG